MQHSSAQAELSSEQRRSARLRELFAFRSALSGTLSSPLCASHISTAECLTVCLWTLLWT